MRTLAHRTRSVLAVGIVGLALAMTVVALDESPAAARADAPPLAELAGTGPLDGRVFEARLGPKGDPPDVNDALVFADGLFVSTECERRCDYPPRPYFVRERDGAYEFVSETRCPNKDATLVWRGTVDGDVISGEVTWTVSRWYWTIEKTFTFNGRLSERVASLVD